MSDCARTVDALLEGGPLPPAVRDHAAGCPACASLVQTDAGLSRALADSPPSDGSVVLPPALRAALLADHAPVIPRVWWRALLGPMGALAAVALIGLVVHPRADLGTQSPGRIALGIALSVAGALGALAMASYGGSRGLGTSTRARVGVALGLGAGAVALVGWLTVAVEGSVVRGGLWGHLARAVCTVEGLVAAVPLAWLAARELRGTAAVQPEAAGALVGLGAGFAGLLVQHICCAVMTLDHTLVAHLLPLAAGALAGALSARRWAVP